MAEYTYITIWRAEAPIQKVWDNIFHSEHWPSWWQGAESVTELQKGDPKGIGNLRRYTWKGLLPYRLSFDITTTRIEEHSLLEGAACGDIEGIGRWQFTMDGSETVVRYDWKVRPVKRWLSLLLPVASFAFEWNHNVVMRWGAEGLSRQLSATVTCIAI